MKRLLFFPSLFLSLLTYGQRAGCNDLVVTKVVLELNELELKISGDSISNIAVTMENRCKECSGGPDYTELFVIHHSDTLGAVAINGIPRFGEKPREYPAFSTFLLKELPPINELKIVLDQYCKDIPIVRAKD